MDYKYHPAINIYTDWFADVDATMPFVNNVLSWGYAILEVKTKKKYKYFGKKYYQIRMVATPSVLINKRAEMLYGTEQYELVPIIEKMLKMVKQAGPIIFPWTNK